MAQITATYEALVDVLELTREDALNRATTLSDLVLAEWSALARERLNTTRPAYLRSLQVQNVTPRGFTCGLPASPSTATIAHMIEQGMGSGGIGTTGDYDVRKFLLRGSTRNIRRTKKGALYLHVPFSHSPADIKRDYGPRIRSAMQRLRATTTSPNRRTRWGGRLSPDRVPKLQAHHVADPLAGMVRLASTYSKSANGRPIQQTAGYRTWRTASYANTHPRAWRSRGIYARRIADEVMRRLPSLIVQVY